MLFNVLQRTRQAPLTQCCQPSGSAVLRLRSPALDVGPLGGEVNLGGWGGSWRRRGDGEGDNTICGQVRSPLTGCGGLLRTLPASWNEDPDLDLPIFQLMFA